MGKIQFAKSSAKLRVLKAGPPPVAGNLTTPVADTKKPIKWKRAWWVCEGIWLVALEIITGNMVYNVLFHSVVNPAFSYYKPFIVVLLVLWMLELLGGRTGSILAVLGNLLKSQ
jgi:hypothetical protein